MGSKGIQILLITANVGSIFEDPSEMLKVWSREFLSTVSKLDPKFIALHCQEVGGKNYEKSMKYVEDFVKLLMSSEELRLFDKVRVYIDEDYSSAENFTALGNIYFIHESINDVLTWDFKDLCFVDVDGKEVHSGNIEGVVTKEKAKFPQDFFPECKWSRKGFLRTRWSINGTVFDLINIHLFHDASNFIAMETFPSVYCKNRRRALEHTLQRFHNDRNGTAPFFVFGDFNFRTDTEGVVKKLTEGLITTRMLNQKKDYTKIQFHNEDGELILTVGKKEFNHYEHQDMFLKGDGSWLKSYDRELEAFENQLYEFPLSFPPSYPFEESVTQATAYMQTRCPSWCDRVFLSHTARSLINEEETVQYNVMGKHTCMGDHKPVYLRVDLYSNSGTIRCCPHLVSVPVSPVAACKCCQSYAKIQISVTDMSEYVRGTTRFAVVDSKLLHEPYTKDMLAHDPYTPESAESHSPLPEEKKIIDTAKHQSVSPRILKSRLENILRTEKHKFEPYDALESRCYTQSDSSPKFLGYESDTTQTKLGYTSSETSPKYLGYKPEDSSKFLGYTSSETSPKYLGYKPEGSSKCLSCKTELSRSYGDKKKLGYTLSDTSRYLSCRNDLTIPNDHKKLSYTVSDSSARFLGYKNEIIDRKKPDYAPGTRCDTKSSKTSKFLSKSHSQHLDSKYLDESEVLPRARCMTEVTRKVSRAKLIGTTSAQSMHRLQSHHSSSDEEWFEFEEVEIPETFEEEKIEIKKEIIEETARKDVKKSKKKHKIDACCNLS